MKQRIEYIDIAKAFLILCLLYGHLFLIARLQGYNDIVNSYATRPCKIYATFFMQAFFIFTGLCSSFNKTEFLPFLWKNIKTILIPGITLTILDRWLYNSLPGFSFEHTPSAVEWLIDGGPWFIIALFCSKILYWFICKLEIRTQLLLCWGGYIICLLIREFIKMPNYICYQHTLLMLPYLCIGAIAKQHLETINSIISKIGPFCIIILILEFMFNFPMPVHDYSVGVSIKSFPIHIFNVLLGTFFILWISRLIGKNKFLKTIGQGTLIIYLLNECILKLSYLIVTPVYSDNTVNLCFFYSGAFVLSVFIFYLMIKTIYRKKYLSWIVGKY